MMTNQGKIIFVTKRTIARSLEIIGEAAKKTDPDLSYSTRNMVLSVYFSAEISEISKKYSLRK